MSHRKIVLYIVLMVTLIITAYVLIVVIPSRLAQRSYEGAKTIARDIHDAFQFTPQVQVNNTIVLQQQADIFELTMVSQKFRHEYNWTNTWLGSTKQISINGTFEAKAGFDLNKRFRLDIEGDRAIVTMPEPRLLSLTPAHDITFRDEQGLWNWVSPDDRAKAINAFTKDAQRYANDADFISQAEVAMEKRLTEILKAHGKTLEVRYQKRETLNPL